MKKLFRLTLVGLALLATPLARAGFYQDGDVLLIFRETGFNDVEFDLGGVNQFLNHTNGYTTAVTGWSLSLVTGVFGTDLTGVSVILAATTSPTAANRASWLSTATPQTTAYNVTASDWQGGLWSTINSIGTRPLTYLVPSVSSGYSIDPGGTYKVASYDYIVSGGGAYVTGIPKLGGNANFVVETQAPATFGFWQIQPTNAIPKPAATYIGNFILNAGGSLTFVAGPLQPTIVGVTRVGNVSTVTFTTLPDGASYSLLATNALGGSINTWPVVSGPVAGDGNQHSLSQTATDSANFYAIGRSP